MIPLITDEDLDGNITRGLRRRAPDIDLVRVQDVGLSGADDPVVLEWAAQAGRVLLTQDVSTMSGHAYARVMAGLPMPGSGRFRAVFRSVWRLTRSCCSLSAALKESGRDRWYTFRCS